MMQHARPTAFGAVCGVDDQLVDAAVAVLDALVPTQNTVLAQIIARPRKSREHELYAALSLDYDLVPCNS